MECDSVIKIKMKISRNHKNNLRNGQKGKRVNGKGKKVNGKKVKGKG